MAIEDMRDHEIASAVLVGYPQDVVTLGVGLIRAERAACMEIAARFGGDDAEAIAEQIGQRSFVRK